MEYIYDCITEAFSYNISEMWQVGFVLKEWEKLDFGVSIMLVQIFRENIIIMKLFTMCYKTSGWLSQTPFRQKK